MQTSQQGNDIGTLERFAFGANWTRFLAVLDDERVDAAVSSMRAMLGSDSMVGRSVLDIGSSSGWFSLAAMRLGTARRRYFAGDDRWSVARGSVLDAHYYGISRIV